MANVAKFISETVFLMHYELWKYWMRFRQRNRDGLGLNASTVNGDDQPMFDDDEDEQVN